LRFGDGRDLGEVDLRAMLKDRERGWKDTYKYSIVYYAIGL